MNSKKIIVALFSAFLLVGLSSTLSSCKSCSNENQDQTVELEPVAPDATEAEPGDVVRDNEGEPAQLDTPDVDVDAIRNRMGTLLSDDEINLYFKGNENIKEFPQFEGGYNAMVSWISENVSYPQVASNNGIEGRVLVKFDVDASGQVQNVDLAQGVDPALDKEAIRVVSAMPKWVPAIDLEGNPAGVKNFVLPINFKLR